MLNNTYRPPAGRGCFWWTFDSEQELADWKAEDNIRNGVKIIDEDRKYDPPRIHVHFELEIATASQVLGYDVPPDSEEWLDFDDNDDAEEWPDSQFGNSDRERFHSDL